MTPGPDWRARVGIVLQSTGEFEELTVAEVVSHFAGYYAAPDDPAKVIETSRAGRPAPGPPTP